MFVVDGGEEGISFARSRRSRRKRERKRVKTRRGDKEGKGEGQWWSLTLIILDWDQGAHQNDA